MTVLGAGPSGLWTALTLLKQHPEFEVTMVEKEEEPGGITGSFIYRDLVFDYGSHRLHPAIEAETLEEIKSMLGSDLLKRRRNGRILLEGRFISFPLKPADLLFNLPFSFSAGVFFDSLASVFSSRKGGTTFRDVLLSGLGRTISSRFYFPYAEKLWGLPPRELSPVQAQKRIASGSIGRMISKALSSLAGAENSGGYFYYPAKGFGEIAAKAASFIESGGASILYNSKAVSIAPPGKDTPGSVTLKDGRVIKTDFVFSTIPVAEFVNTLETAVPEAVCNALGKLSSRSMLFCFLELDCPRYTPFDAHYFPGPEVCFSRLSEPKNYSASEIPRDRTGLCFEIPCGENDPIWSMAPGEIQNRVIADLKKTGLPSPEVLSCIVRRKCCVYPVYDLEFKENISLIESYLNTHEYMVSLGRQGLFVHDNTHHTIEMGTAAGKCLEKGFRWNRSRWAEYRKTFETHVVVD